MAKHAHRSSSISGISQSKRGVNIEEVRSKKRNDPEKIVEIMKRKALRKSSSPKPTKVQKSVKKRKSVEKGESSKIASPVSSDFESEEEKVEELYKLDLFDVSFKDDLPQKPSGNLDCGLYMVTYAECLTFEEGVSYVDFDPDPLCMRYASHLWHYGPRKKEEKAQSDDEAPMRSPRKIGITEDTEVLEI
ncbi:hypothetical protein FXO38_29499 [Capsicum annuum]|nr:hypothetical protein FXO38_29499 [Capsicum annuum]